MSLADGRDLFRHLSESWSPVMNLYELIQRLPAFIASHYSVTEEGMVGDYHLGLRYDLSLWQSSHHCPVFPGQPVHTVVTDAFLLLLEPDAKLKNVAKLVAWYSLAAVEEVKRNLDLPESVTLGFRDGSKLDLALMQNANECVNLVVKRLKAKGLAVHKDYEKRKKPDSQPGSSIRMLLDRVESYEEALKEAPNSQIVQHLIMLYNKVIEYYSAINDERHVSYLERLQRLFTEPALQRLMEVSDQGSKSKFIE